MVYVKGFFARLKNQAATNKASVDYWRRQEAYNYATIFPDRHAAQIKFTEDTLLSVLKPDDHIVDLGCADGWHSLVIARHCRSLVGYDFNPPFIELAAKNAADAGLTNCTFHVADVLKLNLEPASADHVVMSGLTTCFAKDADAKAAMGKAARTMKPGGYLLLKDSLTRGDEDELNLSDEYGAAYRTRKNYLRMVERAGLTVLKEAWLDNMEGYGSLMVFARKS